MPTVSIITVNYNQTAITCELLASIKKVNYTDLEVIVVDNCSEQNPETEIKSQYPEVRFIRSPYNSGFAGGNNLGIQQATGNYLLLINNDTEITDGMIETLLATFDKVPDAGIVCPKICYFEPPQLIQYLGYTPLNPYTLRNRTIGNLQPDNPQQYQQIMPTPYAHGAAMMLPRAIIDQVGLMPELFFLYYEELDWCEQIKRKGYGIYVEPKALIYHKESVTTGKNSVLKTYYLTRNRILFAKRNVKTSALALFGLFFVCIILPKNLLLFTLHREFKHAKAFLKGTKDALLH
jgi:GT2 family glycosyltransferase